MKKNIIISLSACFLILLSFSCTKKKCVECTADNVTIEYCEDTYDASGKAGDLSFDQFIQKLKDVGAVCKDQ